MEHERTSWHYLFGIAMSPVASQDISRKEHEWKGVKGCSRCSGCVEVTNSVFLVSNLWKNRSKIPASCPEVRTKNSRSIESHSFVET